MNDITSWISASAAVLALGLSVFNLSWTVRRARAEDRRDQTTAEKEQARLVSAWIENEAHVDSEGETAWAAFYVVCNGSDTDIRNVVMYWTISSDRTDEIGMGVVPAHREQRLRMPKRLAETYPIGYSVAPVTFTDDEGRRWSRDAQGELSRVLSSTP